MTTPNFCYQINFYVMSEFWIEILFKLDEKVPFYARFLVHSEVKVVRLYHIVFISMTWIRCLQHNFFPVHWLSFASVVHETTDHDNEYGYTNACHNNYLKYTHFD